MDGLIENFNTAQLFLIQNGTTQQVISKLLIHQMFK